MEMYALKMVSAVVGGWIGLSLIFHNKPITRYRIVTEGLATAIFSAAMVEKYFINESALVCCVLGFFMGFGNGYVIDMLKAIAPKLARFSLRVFLAKQFDLVLPESVLDENPPENQDDVLDESRDEKAVEWLAKPDPKPPNKINRFKK